MNAEYERRISNYFNLHPKRSLRTIARDVIFQTRIIEQVKTNKLRLFPNKLYIIYELYDCREKIVLNLRVGFLESWISRISFKL